MPPGARQHPRDEPIFRRVGDMGFNLSCLPCNIWGSLKTAPVVLLYLSPGYDPSDLAYAESITGQATMQRRRKGDEPLDSEDEHASGWRWWTSRTKLFGPPDMFREKVAILNIGAYHSESFTDQHTLMALPSSRAMLDWAQAVLMPQAERGERVVVCMRKARAWGLSRGENHSGTLFAPPTNVGGHMAHGSLREEIVRIVRQRLGTDH